MKVKQLPISLKSKLAVFFILGVFSLIAAEGVLQIGKSRQYFIRKPNRHFFTYPEEIYLPGVRGTAVFTVNELGLRGDPLRGQEIKILTVGASTTECGYLDDHEAWPYLLQESLKKQTGQKVWVGNAGKPALNSRHHVLQINELLKQIPDLDLIIVLIGANESRPLLDQNYDPNGIDNSSIRETCLSAAFESMPTTKIRHRRDLELYKLILDAKGRFLSHSEFLEMDKLVKSGVWYEKKRKERQAAKKISLSENLKAKLSLGLNEYEKNIRKIYQSCQHYGTKVLFLTQPALYNGPMTKAEEKLLWGGLFDSKKPDIYFSTDVMRDALQQYNKQLLATGKADGFEVFNLDAVISPLSDSFYDDVHYNEIGARRVSAAISKAICKQTFLNCEH